MALFWSILITTIENYAEREIQNRFAEKNCRFVIRDSWNHLMSRSIFTETIFCEIIYYHLFFSIGTGSHWLTFWAWPFPLHVWLVLMRILTCLSWVSNPTPNQAPMDILLLWKKRKRKTKKRLPLLFCQSQPNRRRKRQKKGGLYRQRPLNQMYRIALGVVHKLRLQQEGGGSLNISTCCQRLYHIKCQHRA